MRKVSGSVDFDKFSLCRTRGKHHSQHFDVKLYGLGVATMYFDRYGASDNEPYIWLRVDNYILYDKLLLIETLSLTELLDFSFNNYTHLDLARDYLYNIGNRIRILMRNPELTTIVNGKQIKDRNKILNNVTRICNISLDRDGGKSLTIKQSKAIKNKYDGITLDSYDKVNEIKSKSHKQYILNFYGNPKRLHRLEVRLNNDDIKGIAKSLCITLTEDIIFDINKLDAIYLQALHSLLRFTHGRKKLDWEMLFDCNLRYR
ncbi:MAG: hypothetical protein IKW36_06265 [Alistipes sp.]|nr:hypothetical protein [Alistipes sp.]